jgi:hypothetical protein
MPIGILNITMKTSYKFKNAQQLGELIDDYFLYIKGEYELTQPKGRSAKPIQKIYSREPEFPTISSLALFLGFDSMIDFKQYEEMRKYSRPFKHARLRIEAAYQQLLFEKPTATIFALKSMGWNDKPGATKTSTETHKTLKVEMTSTGPKPASTEKEVDVLI